MTDLEIKLERALFENWLFEDGPKIPFENGEYITKPEQDRWEAWLERAKIEERKRNG